MGPDRRALVYNYSVPIVDPGYQKNYEWEKFDYLSVRQWMEDHWHWSVYFAVAYIVLIFIGRKAMKNREAVSLRAPLLLWNILLAVFSVLAFFRVVPELFYILEKPNGFYVSVCTRNHMTMSLVFWEWIGTLSKVVELGDTAFVVLRKQPLIFLHWYHHATVMLFTWFAFEANDPVHRWFMCMNYFVHGIMYSYYGIRAAGVKLPKALALVITSVQILQMVVGVAVNVFSLYAIGQNWPCARRDSNIYLALGMYATYFLLFLNFFVKTYVSRKPKTA